jgi:hypothetical protein
MKTTLKQFGRIIAVFALAALLVAGGTAAAGPGDPQPATVRGIESYTMYSSGSIVTATTTLYGGNQSGEADRYTNYNGLDVFVTADISGTRTTTVTMQYSADGTNWVDASYEYVGTPLNYSTTVTASTTSTTTATTTSTVSTSGTPTVYEDEYQIVLSADGTDFLQMPVTGLYVRPKIEVGGTITQNRGLTLTITAIARNN